MKKKILIVTLVVLALLLSACDSGGNVANVMRLRRAEGTVSVSDDAGGSVQPQENLGLYSGYGVGTQLESYAWIDLDGTKLTKMDQNSEIGIVKEDKHLSIEVKSGSLFFNVTEPLAEDETLEISSSSMLVGIRGTCGWVEVADANAMKLFLLEGTVSCEAGGEPQTVQAGETATMTADGDVTVEKFSSQDIPAFVFQEVKDDDKLAADILAASGIDVISEQLAKEQYLAILAQADTYFEAYYGDDEPTVSYTYALIQMQSEHQIPALVLKEETVSYMAGDMSNVIVFQYDPGRAEAIQLEGFLSEGVASAGGYRGGLAASGDGVGLLETSWSSGTGNGTIVKATAVDGKLQLETLFDGFLFDGANPTLNQITSQQIYWRNVNDLSPLDGSSSESSGPLAAFAGTYTPYEDFHGAYGGGERLRDITLTAGGMVTGGGTSWLTIEGNGVEPAGVYEIGGGAYEIAYPNSAAIYAIYPAGVVPDGYATDYWRSKLDMSKVHVRYLFVDGGVMDVLYHN